MKKIELFLKSKWKDKLKGGKADKKSPKDFNKKALLEGMRHELEHTSSKKLAMEIAMDHLTEDPNYYKKLKSIEKSEASYQYKNTTAAVPVVAQDAAERTASQALVEYIRSSINSDLEKIPLLSGMLTVFKKDQGLYNGFFQDNDGQVVEEFENATVEILAKILEVKGYYIPPEPTEAPTAVDPMDMPVSAREAIGIARAEVAEHVKDYHENAQTSGKYMRIKYGDFELEIKKSMQSFIVDLKRGFQENIEVKKALNSWRRNHNLKYKSDLEAAQDLINNWDTHGEAFQQVVHALKVTNE